MTQIELPLDAIDPLALVARLDFAATPAGVSRVTLRKSGSAGAPPEAGRVGQLRRRAREEIAEFLAGQRTFFSVPVDLAAVPPLERSALEVAAHIPFGEVRTYKWIAEQLGQPVDAQTVGGAMAHNPVPVLVPCHRVVRSDGGLGGYSFGLMQKAALLNLERSVPPFVGCPGTLVVCRRGCDHERRSDGPRISFRSVADAARAGYRPCDACRPPAV